MSKISGIQKRVLEFIVYYKSVSKGVVPSASLIAAKFGWHSEHSARTHILALEKKGYVSTKNVSRRQRELVVLKNADGTPYKEPVFVEVKCFSKRLTDLQKVLPWTIHYHHDFRANPQSHKDFAHANLHVQKAIGKIASVINDAEHKGHDFNHKSITPYVVDLVICALRMANTCPSGAFDLEEELINRLELKNQVRFSFPENPLPSPMAN